MESDRVKSTSYALPSRQILEHRKTLGI